MMTVYRIQVSFFACLGTDTPVCAARFATALFDLYPPLPPNTGQGGYGGGGYQQQGYGGGGYGGGY